MFLQYIKGIREKISKACRPLGIHLRKSLKKVKERPGMMDVNGIVHSIPCAEYSATYVGETRRTLKVRMAEHRKVMKNKNPKNGIVIHVQRLHTPLLTRSKDPCKGEQLGRRRALEALEIQQRRPMINPLMLARF